MAAPWPRHDMAMTAPWRGHGDAIVARGWMLGGQATADMLNVTNSYGKSVKDVAWYNKEAKDLVDWFGGKNFAPPCKECYDNWIPHDHHWQRKYYRASSRNSKGWYH
jgi:hypothetical protein